MGFFSFLFGKFWRAQAIFLRVWAKKKEKKRKQLTSKAVLFKVILKLEK